MGRIKVNSCPFCNSQKYDLGIKKLKSDKFSWFIECKDCEARGSLSQTVLGAVALWNKVTRALQGKIEDESIFMIDKDNNLIRV